MSVLYSAGHHHENCRILRETCTRGRCRQHAHFDTAHTLSQSCHRLMPRTRPRRSIVDSLTQQRGPPTMRMPCAHCPWLAWRICGPKLLSRLWWTELGAACNCRSSLQVICREERDGGIRGGDGSDGGRACQYLSSEHFDVRPRLLRYKLLRSSIDLLSMAPASVQALPKGLWMK